MLKNTLGALIALAVIASPAVAAEKKKPRPQLTAQVLDGMQSCSENLARLKVQHRKIYINPRTGIPRG